MIHEKKMKYYFIDPRDHQDRETYSNELWASIAQSGGYVFTEEEYEKVKGAEYLEMMVYRKF